MPIEKVIKFENFPHSRFAISGSFPNMTMAEIASSSFIQIFHVEGKTVFHYVHSVTTFYFCKTVCSHAQQ
jgi:hypothetical protein